MVDDLTQAVRLLGIGEDEVRVLALLPLVQVAWADGEVQKGERALILDLATNRYGLDDDARRVLETWLTYAPSEQYFARGRDLMLQLIHAGRLDLELEQETTPFDSLHGDAKAVARAAGGFFGIRAVESTEQRALAEIKEAFEAFHSNPPPPEPVPDATVVGETFHDGWDELDDDTDERSMRDASTWDEAMEDPPAHVFQAPEIDALKGFDPEADRLEAMGGPTLVQVSGDVEVPYSLMGEVLAVGRHGDNDVLLPTDGLVSKHHARVYREGVKVFVKDLDSTNGTYVNSERVVERRLFGGEKVRFGSAIFEYRGGDMTLA